MGFEVDSRYGMYTSFLAVAGTVEIVNSGYGSCVLSMSHVVFLDARQLQDPGLCWASRFMLLIGTIVNPTYMLFARGLMNQ